MWLETSHMSMFWRHLVMIDRIGEIIEWLHDYFKTIPVATQSSAAIHYCLTRRRTSQIPLAYGCTKGKKQERSVFRKLYDTGNDIISALSLVDVLIMPLVSNEDTTILLVELLYRQKHNPGLPPYDELQPVESMPQQSWMMDTDDDVMAG